MIITIKQYILHHLVFKIIRFGWFFLIINTLWFGIKAQADTYHLQIKEASCSLCTLDLVKNFSNLKGVQDVTIEPQTQTVILRLYGNMTLPEKTIWQKIKESNLTPMAIKHIENDKK